MRSSAALSKHDCPKFVKVTGVNLNDGAPVDRFGCVDSFLPMLLIENAQMQRQTGAAVESFRNEMVKAGYADDGPARRRAIRAAAGCRSAEADRRHARGD
jgi:hypothetical protein